MNLTSGIIEVDLHGLRVEDAVKKVKNEVRKAPGSVYTIRLIHGFHGGTRIKDAIEDEFSYGSTPEQKLHKVRINSRKAIKPKTKTETVQI